MAPSKAVLASAAVVAAAMPAAAFTGSMSVIPLRANVRASASAAPLTMAAHSEAHAMRRAIVRSGVAAASTAFLSQVPALAAWEEYEDDDGTPVWVNEETGEESKTDPTKKKKKGKKAKAPAADTAAEPAASAPVEKGKEGGLPKISSTSGQVTKYKDINKGFQILKPNGWNQFDTAPGEYDVKWEDLVEKSELVMVGSSPVKTATSVDALGDVDTVGANLAKKKKAVLVDAKTNEKEGVKYYTFVFKADDDKKGAREVYQLCINKGKLWSVTATTSEKRWAKRKELYGAIMASFAPKL